jgi:uncharacterized protein YkwD
MKLRCLLFLFFLLPLTTAAVSSEEAATITPEAVIERTNQERVARGLPALSVNENLTRAANAKARDMLQREYFAHAEWERFIRTSGYFYCSAGENLGLNQTEAGELVGEWMDSPTHRANLLKSRYREIGVAVVRGNYKGFDVTIIVQMLGARCL